MRIDPPVELTKNEFAVRASEIEPFLRAPAMDLKPWPNTMIQHKDKDLENQITYEPELIVRESSG